MMLREALKVLNVRIMRMLAPACEAQRREFREARARVEAHAEQLQRTIREEVRAWKRD